MEAVIFDLDGVLIDSEPIHYRAFVKTLENEGIRNVSFEYYKKFVGSTNQHMWEVAIRDFGLTKDIALLRKIDEENREAFLKDDGYIPLPGATELVKDLHRHHVKLAVASSSPQIYIQDAANSLHIQDCFLELVTGESVKDPKPAPDIFLKAAKLLGAVPNSCTVIEDSSNGVRAAKAAGMICVALRNPNSGNQDLSQADWILDSFIGLDYETLQDMLLQLK